MDVLINHNKSYKIEVGDVFYSNKYESFYILKKVGHDNYSLLPLNFENLYDRNSSMVNFNDILEFLKDKVSKNQLIHYPKSKNKMILSIEPM